MFATPKRFTRLRAVLLQEPGDKFAKLTNMAICKVINAAVFGAHNYKAKYVCMYVCVWVCVSGQAPTLRCFSHIISYSWQLWFNINF